MGRIQRKRRTARYGFAGDLKILIKRTSRDEGYCWISI
jgi:hypothetical protein